ncbi:MAG: biotin--[acetyl-CoA-carboxylase] ligase [Desulfobulbaceae bacterium]|nr:MAG: biotin--[acetyl-CoA-carboxylase] ligase [Desulfobulbaceae bacterium]
MTNRLNVQGLRNYITEREIPLRKRDYAGLDVEIIFRKGGFIGSNIECFSELDRTMHYGRSVINQFERLGDSVVSGSVIIAERLSGSKGRFTRSWYAPSGGLWGSIIYVNTLLPASKLLIPLALGVSCCEALHEWGAAEAEVRWINDVLFHEQKLAGFLLESHRGVESTEEYILIGFGINLNNTTFPSELKKIAVSLSEIIGDTIERDDFALCFLAKLAFNFGLICHEEDYYLVHQQYQGVGGTHLLVNRWRELSQSIGRDVVFGFDVVTRPQYRAKVMGIAEDGGLMMQLEDGSTTIEYSGEIRYL